MQSLLSEIRQQGSGGNGPQQKHSSLRHVPETDRRDRSSASASTARLMANTMSTPDEEEQEKKTVKYFLDSGCCTWYDDIKDITFTSSFCDLTIDEALIIIEHYEQQQKAHLVASDDPSNNPTIVSENIFQMVSEKLEPLRKRLAETLKCEVAKSPVGRAFVKLSTRSPKDSKKALKRAELAYRSRLLEKLNQTQQQTEDDTISENDRWIMLSEEVTKSLSIETPEEAIELLLDSERVYEDLRYVLGAPTTTTVKVGEGNASARDNAVHGKGGTRFEMQIVARAWDPRLTPSTELRGICWDSKLTCLCQYFHPLYFPHLAVVKDQIQTDVQRTFERSDVQRAVRKLGGHCIVDFAWLGPGEVIIVELNPFDGVGLGTFPASTGLFLWEDPSDRRTMTGEAPFEFRIREQPAESHELKSNCSRAWREIIYQNKHTVK